MKIVKIVVLLNKDVFVERISSLNEIILLNKESTLPLQILKLCLKRICSSILYRIFYKRKTFVFI